MLSPQFVSELVEGRDRMCPRRFLRDIYADTFHPVRRHDIIVLLGAPAYQLLLAVFAEETWLSESGYSV